MFVLCLGFQLCKAVAVEIPLSDFARQAQFDNVKISPDGKHLAVTFIKGDKGMLAILKRDSLELVNNFSTWEAGSGIYDMEWISPTPWGSSWRKRLLEIR